MRSPPRYGGKHMCQNTDRGGHFLNCKAQIGYDSKRLMFGQEDTPFTVWDNGKALPKRRYPSRLDGCGQGIFSTIEFNIPYESSM